MNIYPPGVWVQHQGVTSRGLCARCEAVPIPPSGPQGRAGYWTRGEESRETAPERSVPCFLAPPAHRGDDAALPRCEWFAPGTVRGITDATQCTEPGRMQWNHQDGKGSLAHYCHAHAVRMAEITLGIMRTAAAAWQRV